MAPDTENLTRWPIAAPTLDEGWHPLGPGTEGCLMELVSVLANEPWSDTPRCTHPALAEVARLVNDACSSRGREALLPLAGELVGTAGLDARVAPTVVAIGVEHARRTGLRAALLLSLDVWQANRRLARLQDGGRLALWCRFTDRAYWLGPGSRAIASAVTVIARSPEPDERLRQLLEECLHAGGDLLESSSALREAEAVS